MKIYDKLRKKEVELTPEEEVRQWFISQLEGVMGVPAHLMMSEVGFRYGEKQYRADILVYDRQGQPLCVVECKRPEVQITEAVSRQALRYSAVLTVKAIILTNGKNTYIYGRKGDGFEALTSIPTFEDLLNI